MKSTGKAPSKIASLIKRAVDSWGYFNSGVWQDSRKRWWISVIKVASLTMRGFTDGSLQNKACAMTYRTMLAVVPMLALLLAIGRGFGLQDYLQKELYSYLPSQHRMLDWAFKFVDSYLQQASGGLFVGVGIVFLLWTLISLLGSVEEVFDGIWMIKSQRTIWRKITDYTAILIILPILMICSSGITILMSTTLQKIFDFEFITPVITWILDCASVVLSWLFFAGAYMLIPNTKVNFKNAIVAGVLAGTGFQVLQWLFVSGQMYVAKYNAIYGSFSFLPLMLLWLQLVWLVTFIGAGVCYSMQNIFQYSFESQIQRISFSYRLKVTTALLTVVVQRFANNEKPLTCNDLIEAYNLPPRLATVCLRELLDMKLLCHVVPVNPHVEVTDMPLQPTHESGYYTLSTVVTTILNHGDSKFIPGFERNFNGIESTFDKMMTHIEKGTETTLLTQIRL